MSADKRIIDLSTKERFKLSDSFLTEYRQKKPHWGPVGEFTYRRTYSRQKDDGSHEDWWETVQRVVEGTYTVQKWHCRNLGLPWDNRKAQRSAQEMYDLMFSMKFLPPGRGLWMMGTDYVERRGSAPLQNCGHASTEYIAQDFAEPFTFLMDMSMLGVGVGGNTRGAGTMKIVEPRVGADTHVVEDSREGWVSLIERILNAYAGRGSLPTEVDYTQLRALGTPIAGFGGTSSGPQPLINLVEGIHETLKPLVGRPITSEAIVDLFNRIGVCVVSGNVRRSAEIMLGDPDDEEFMSLKDPEKNAAALVSHRWASNNSIFGHVGMDYTRIANQIAKNGEPGIFYLEAARAYSRLKDAPDWKDSAAVGTNPCSEQTLEHMELCCLVETFPARHDTLEEYLNTLKYAYLYGKTVTLIPTHNERTNAVQLRNRRIGTSQSGIIDSFVKHGRRAHFQWSDAGYEFLQRLDAKYSDWLCIPRSKKITSVKPSGTVSLLNGSSPGIHYPHDEYYYRTVRVSKTSPLVEAMRDAGYRVEDDIYDRSKGTAVIYFPVHEEHFDQRKTDATMWEQLENAAQLQYWWADNQVSVTVTFKPEEAKDIAKALELYETRLKSVSFLPLTEHGYAQAPYISITQEEFEEASAKLKPVDYSFSVHEKTDSYCDGDKCEIPIVESEEAS